MHPCLYVDEIVRLIAHELVTSTGWATSVALACCCKSFEDPVLDALWETQSRVLPLLNSLPDDVWGEGRCHVSAPMACVSLSLNCLIQKSLKRLPTALEWARFRKYARRMRKFGEWYSLYYIPSGVFQVQWLCAICNEPLLSNLDVLHLWRITEEAISSIPSFISPRTTTIDLAFDGFNLPNGTVTSAIASVVTTFPTLCPNLQKITLQPLPRDPMITAAVSKMLLSSNRNTLRSIHVDSPLTEEACEAIYKHSDLHELLVVVEKGTSLTSAVLPNLTDLAVKCDHDGDSLPLFRGAMLGRLEVVYFHNRSERIGDFLESFERVALEISVQNTLTRFRFYTPHSWNPKYSSLLPFTHLTDLVVEFFCNDGCSSRVDDDVIMNLARAMPKLTSLRLGRPPCGKTPTGVTAKGFEVLANHCLNLSSLCVHFQVASLSAPPAISGTISDAGPTGQRRDCALTDLGVGEIPMAEESVLVVALTLIRIFPRIDLFSSGTDENWKKVLDAIRVSRQVVDCLGKEHYFSTTQSDFSDTSPETTPENGS